VSTDRKQVEKELHLIDDIWSKTRPGKRVCGGDRDGNSCVFPVEDIRSVLGRFESPSEAEAYALSAGHIERLAELVKKLLDERDEARLALHEISQVADPAYEAFNEQKPVDMATVLRTTHRWSHFVLRP